MALLLHRSLLTMKSPSPMKCILAVSFGSAVATTLYVSPADAALRCASNMAIVGASCVDKYEASLVELTADGREVPFSAHHAPNGHAVKAVSRRGVPPQAHTSLTEARRACDAAGKRLCRADEWTRACRGPEDTRYPYGNERIANACVDTNRTSPINTKKQGVFDFTTMNDPALNQMPNTVEPTGAMEACTNAYGVHDMVGNVHEWADDGAFHGGYYLDTEINGEGCSYKTTAHNATYYDYSTGFRCCADAEDAPEEEAAPRPIAAPKATRAGAPAEGPPGAAISGTTSKPQVRDGWADDAAMRKSYDAIELGSPL